MVHIKVKDALKSHPERRDANFRRGFAQRLRREFAEISELCLTPAQTSQLFGVPEQECGRIYPPWFAPGFSR